MELNWKEALADLRREIVDIKVCLPGKSEPAIQIFLDILLAKVDSLLNLIKKD